MSKTILNLTMLVTIAAGICFSSCGGKPAKAEDPLLQMRAEKMADSIIAAARAPKVENTTWTYEDKEDKMGDNKHFASIVSSDILKFDFPYDGGSVSTLTLRREGKSQDVIFTVRPGHFLTNYDGTKIRLRFDDEKPKSYTASEASDGSNDILFINSESDVIKRLKAAKKLVIEAEFYQEGLNQVEFNVEGLKWD